MECHIIPFYGRVRPLVNFLLTLVTIGCSLFYCCNIVTKALLSGINNLWFNTGNLQNSCNKSFALNFHKTDRNAFCTQMFSFLVHDNSLKRQRGQGSPSQTHAV